MTAVCTWWCFISKLRLVVFLFPLSSDITVLSSCGGSCAIHTQVTSFPFIVHTGCLGEGVAGMQCEPRANMFLGVIAHLVRAAGCRALVVWGNAVSGFPGMFGKLQKQNENSFSITLSTVSSIALYQMEGMGYGSQVGSEGSRSSFWGRPTRPLTPAPPPKNQ